MTVPQIIWLYRITHIDNLKYIFKHGLYTRHSHMFDPDYVSIGDSSLIDYRKNLEACNPPGGKLSDYIPFYLGPRSPMLYQIAKGYEDVIKYNQTSIVYLITSYDLIVNHRLEHFFTDVNARVKTANYYTQKQDFNKLDWETIYSQYWKSDETDLERKQKKQAEFLVKYYIPVSCIAYIGVYDDNAKQNVLHLLKNENLNIPIRISPDKLYYDNL